MSLQYLNVVPAGQRQSCQAGYHACQSLHIGVRWLRLCCRTPATDYIQSAPGKLPGTAVNTIHSDRQVQDKTDERHQPDQPGPGRCSAGFTLVQNDVNRRSSGQQHTEQRQYARPVLLPDMMKIKRICCR